MKLETFRMLFVGPKTYRLVLDDRELNELEGLLAGDGWVKGEVSGFFSSITSLSSFTFKKERLKVEFELDDWFNYADMNTQTYNAISPIIGSMMGETGESQITMQS